MIVRRALAKRRKLAIDPLAHCFHADPTHKHLLLPFFLANQVSKMVP
jgi:hypothetical protein